MWESKTCGRKESSVVNSISSLRYHVLKEVPSRLNELVLQKKKHC